MRTRYLRYDFFLDEDIKDLPYEARLFYMGLWCVSDREGRGEDRPARLKIAIMPYDNIDAEKMMNLLSQPKTTGRPFINRYAINGERYYEIINWHKHQKPHNTEAISKIPPTPPNTNIKQTIKETMNIIIKPKPAPATNINGDITVKEPLNSEIIELKGLKLYETDKKLLKQWPEVFPAWKQAYPAVDIIAEIKKAHAWEMSNPTKKKIDKIRFLGSWLSRCQDKPQGGFNNVGKNQSAGSNKHIATDASKYDGLENQD